MLSIAEMAAHVNLFQNARLRSYTDRERQAQPAALRPHAA